MSLGFSNTRHAQKAFSSEVVNPPPAVVTQPPPSQKEQNKKKGLPLPKLPKIPNLPKLEVTVKDPTLKKGLAKVRAFASSVL